MIPVWMNYIGDEEQSLMIDSINSMRIMEGPVLKEFEDAIRKLLGVKHVIGTSSGTASLALALLGIGIEPGDEVIVPDMTFIATANAPKMLGAKVISVPVESTRPILDINRIDEYITEKTKAIITVDLNGRISWSKELKEKYASKGIKIIDDACQAFLSGENGAFCGTQADIGCFSFGITKTVTTVNGGAVVTNDDTLDDRMKVIKTQGMKSVFDGDKYYMPGFNFKLPDVLASVGVEQLKKIDEKKEHMLRIDEMYRSGLSDIDEIEFLESGHHEFRWMTDAMCNNRGELITYLKSKNIVSRPAAPPLHTAEYICRDGDYGTSFCFSNKQLFLPCGPNQPYENVDRVIDEVRSYYKK